MQKKKRMAPPRSPQGEAEEKKIFFLQLFCSLKTFSYLCRKFLQNYPNAQQHSNIQKFKRSNIQKFGASPIAEF
jgi:hypothetical protein